MPFRIDQQPATLQDLGDLLLGAGIVLVTILQRRAPQYHLHSFQQHPLGKRLADEIVRSDLEREQLVDFLVF